MRRLTLLGLFLSMFGACAEPTGREGAESTVSQADAGALRDADARSAQPDAGEDTTSRPNSTTDAGLLEAVDAGTGAPAPSDADPPPTDAGSPIPCAYPANATEPMTLGGVLYPYAWPSSLDGAGSDVPLDLANVPCNDDDNLDWSPFDVLLFISIPAW